MPSTEQEPAATPAGPRWRVDLLGGLRLDDGGRVLTRLPSRATTALLARLALLPERVHPREELIELLWPGVALGVGRNRLRQALSSLKSVLEPPGSTQRVVLAADRDAIHVVAGAIECDALLFEVAVRTGRIDDARALYRGDLLPGHYDDWIDEERLRLAAIQERAMLHSEAAASAPSPVSPATSAAPHKTSSRPPRFALPSYLTPLFGIDEQAATLRELLLERRLITVIGPGGSGKTRLAVELATLLREGDAAWPRGVPPSQRGFDLVAFIALAGCTSRHQTLDALAAAFQLTTTGDDPMASLTQALADRRALIVLDNFEQLVGVAEEVIGNLVERLPQLHCLVTSRRSLGLDGEVEFALAPLTVPPTGQDINSSASSPAVALFVDRARAVRSDFHLSQRNHDVLADLVRELEGMPLAIELAASRVRSMAPADMLARLRAAGSPRLDLLARGTRRSSVELRHASMQRVVAWSWDLLDAPTARLLARLALFPASFTAAAAQWLLADTGQDATLSVDDLLAHSLLRADGEIDGHMRFALYQPVREFAAAQLSGDDRRHFRQQLRRWSLDWAATLPATPSLAALRAEMPNLLAAMAAAVEDGLPDQALQLLFDLRRCLEDVELPAAGLALACRAVAASGDPVTRARGQTLLGPLLFTAGQPQFALEHAEAGLACAALTPPQRARALHALARVRWRSRRRAEDVEPLLDEVQGILAQHDDFELQASLLALRAFVVNAHHKDFVHGSALHAEALALWEHLANQHAINSGRYNLAACAQSAHRDAEALRMLEPIIASAREFQDWRRLSQALNVRGNAFAGLRAWKQALAAYHDCIQVAWEGTASFDLAYGLWNLPRALAHDRRPEPAAQLAGFAARFWQTHFGALSSDDLRYLTRIRRLVARQLGAPAVERLWREGEAMPLAQAVALALVLSAT